MPNCVLNLGISNRKHIDQGKIKNFMWLPQWKYTLIVLNQIPFKIHFFSKQLLLNNTVYYLKDNIHLGTQPEVLTLVGLEGGGRSAPPRIFPL